MYILKYGRWPQPNIIYFFLEFRFFLLFPWLAWTVTGVAAPVVLVESRSPVEESSTELWECLATGVSSSIDIIFFSVVSTWNKQEKKIIPSLKASNPQYSIEQRDGEKVHRRRKGTHVTN